MVFRKTLATITICSVIAANAGQSSATTPVFSTSGTYDTINSTNTSYGNPYVCDVCIPERVGQDRFAGIYLPTGKYYSKYESTLKPINSTFFSQYYYYEDWYSASGQWLGGVDDWFVPLLPIADGPYNVFSVYSFHGIAPGGEVDGAAYTVEQIDTPVGFGANYKYDSGVLTYSFSIYAVPEPETWTLMLLGLVLVGVVARRKRDICLQAPVS